MSRALFTCALCLLACATAPDTRLDRLVRTRLDQAARRPILKFDLGVPMPTETPETRELVAMGPRIVPALIDASKTAPAPQTTYAVLVLGRLADPRARQPLEKLRARYLAKSSPEPWDRAVAGQCNAALDALGR